MSYVSNALLIGNESSSCTATKSVKLEKQLQEPVDQVYMAKLLFALWNQLREEKLNSHSAIAVIHSGGQQGRRGLQPSN